MLLFRSRLSSKKEELVKQSYTFLCWNGCFLSGNLFMTSHLEVRRSLCVGAAENFERTQVKRQFLVRVQTGYYANMMYLMGPAWAFSSVFNFRVCASPVEPGRRCHRWSRNRISPIQPLLSCCQCESELSYKFWVWGV